MNALIPTECRALVVVKPPNAEYVRACRAYHAAAELGTIDAEFWEVKK